MADTYAELTGSGSATSPYDTWAKAADDIQTALTQAGAGGRCFVKDDSGATNPDTAASARTLTFPGTKTNTTFLIGVKSTTTNEPPVDSDLAIRGADNLPIFEATGANHVGFGAGFGHMTGIRIESTNRIFRTVGAGSIYSYKCELAWNTIFFVQNVTGYFHMRDCDFIMNAVGAHFLVQACGVIEVFGGLISGSTPIRLIDTGPDGIINFSGTDLSNAGSTLVDFTGADNFTCQIRNCKVPSAVALTSGTAGNDRSSVELITSNEETALGSGESIRDYKKATLAGDIGTSFVDYRTGGADDDADGVFAYELTPNIDATNECGHSLSTPWMAVWVAGDGSTAKIFTVFIANDGASDYNTDDARFELLTPDDGGTATHDYSVDQDVINGSSTAITDDAVSSWNGSVANAQKLSVTITPDFEGWVYGRVHFSKRFASSPETLYVDPILVVT